MTIRDLNSSDFDEVRVISLPPPQTAAVNKLLLEETGWVLVDARVTERLVVAEAGATPRPEPIVHYVMAHQKQP
jgi:hypothetical protein